MRYIESSRVLELTARNISALLAKLDDQLSSRILLCPAGAVMVRAVEDTVVGGDEAATRVAATSEGVVTLTRRELQHLSTPGASTVVGPFTVRSVPDDAHYLNRAPGVIYMPESGETR
ncbi:hypothetical protein [Mycolicibacterium sp. CBMA 226]|uniref:hypothetical protein n=1 Tax=Mycolicibacterium sp. CBMA 226 TaxID=2606611 RepID=UPI0012DE18AB|nr:hypothetical protein [Mycolicibacterium sp. CBMA 226]MUL78968.1 hypothetical protein [Mycolicibacterium sp. CBMA 226]QGW61279.1 hypothetical protein ICEMyc226_00247 [Mycolicibacterium sp.]